MSKWVLIWWLAYPGHGTATGSETFSDHSFCDRARASLAVEFDKANLRFGVGCYLKEQKE